MREKRSLCYYANSMLEMHKGLLLVSSGIDETNYDDARDEILAQLDAMRRGEVTDEELTAAKNSFASDMRAITDSQGRWRDTVSLPPLMGTTWVPRSSLRWRRM